MANLLSVAEKKTAEGASGAARSEGNKEKDQQDATAAPLSVVALDSCLEARAVWGVPFSLHTRLKAPLTLTQPGPPFSSLPA